MKNRKLKIVFNSPTVLAFVFISFAAMMIGYLTAGLTDRLLFTTYRSSLKDPFTYIRFFTHVLGHAGWEHYIGNMAYILLLGPLLEEKYGSKKILEIIAITALITGVINYLLFSNVALCGASGIVFAFILLTSFTGFRDGELPITFILVAVIFLGQQICEGLFVKDNVSNLSHVLGGVIGAIAGYQLNKK
ncbi:MAG: rhomboid family intramembrane serine protease [Lachnospiraceae bacterium]|nr:rhomboid family intramembrane serine protease [Lachnospiraceae bacterium]